MMNAALRGKPYEGNPHVRFDGGEVASAKPRRGSPLNMDRISCSVLSALCAGMVVLFAVNAVAATTYYWRGGGADANWSTKENWSPEGVPGQTDTVIFDGQSGTDTSDIDGDFGAGVFNLTLTANFEGAIVQQREFAVYHTYTQNAGTFTCGGNVFMIGNKGVKISNTDTWGDFYCYGGTFNGPVDAEFRWWSRSHQVNFVVNAAAAFDCSRSDFKFYISSAGGQIAFTCAERTFGSFEMFTPGTENNAKSTCKFTGTNTVAGTFIHGAGILSDTATGGSYGNAAFNLQGDLVVTNYPAGCAGKGGMTFFFKTPNDQTITTYLPTNTAVAGTAALYVDKPSGKLTVKGKKLLVSSSGTSRTYGLVFRRGVVDMSELQWLALQCYNSDFYHYEDDCAVSWPDRVQISGFTCNFRVRNQTFHHLRINSSDSRLNACFATTNTVTGWLEDTSFGFSGVADTTWYPEASTANKGKPPVLRLLGPGVNIITNKTSTYAGNYGQSGGFGVLSFEGPTNQVIIGGDSRVYLPSLHIRKPEGKSVTVDTVDGWMGLRATGAGMAGGDILVVSGVFSGPTNRLEWSSYNSVFRQYDGAVITNMDATYINAISWSPSIGIRVPVARIRHDNDLKSGGGNGLQILDGYTCTVTRLVTSYRGYLKGNAGKALLDVKGDFEVGAYCDGGYCPIRFSGDKVQHYSNPSNRVQSSRDWEVAKSGGRLVLDTDLDISRNGTPKLTLSSGELDVNGHRVLAKGEVVLRGGATLGVPAAPEVNELPWVSTTGQLTEKYATEENPFLVRLVNNRSYFDGETLSGRVNVFGCGSFEKGTTHDPKRFRGTASRALSKRTKVLLNDAENKILYMDYRVAGGFEVFAR